ncbi:response regulator transcription factor [Thermodesulfitimonas sp.]
MLLLHRFPCRGRLPKNSRCGNGKYWSFCSARGVINKVAAELHLSIRTVRTHRQHIYRKFGTGSLDELSSDNP